MRELRMARLARGRSGWAGAVAALLTMALALLVWPMATPVAWASSAGGISITPSSGPVGTVVDVTINVALSAATMYAVSATTSDPTQGGCSSAKAIPGVGPVTVATQGGHTQFPWPKELSAGPYWLCAAPQSGSGASAYSQTPFTVTSASGPTPTATVRGYDQQALVAAYFDAPAGGVAAGASALIVVTNWVSADGAPPSRVTLFAVQGDGATAPAGTEAPFTVERTPGTAAGDYTVHVTIPAATSPGAYVVAIGTAFHLTAHMQVVAAKAAPAPPAAPGATQDGGAWPLQLWLLLGIAVLLLGAVIFVGVGMARNRAGAPRR